MKNLNELKTIYEINERIEKRLKRLEHALTTLVDKFMKEEEFDKKLNKEINNIEDSTKPIWEEIIEIGKGIPEGELNKLTTDKEINKKLQKQVNELNRENLRVQENVLWKVSIIEQRLKQNPLTKLLIGMGFIEDSVIDGHCNYD